MNPENQEKTTPKKRVRTLTKRIPQSIKMQVFGDMLKFTKKPGVDGISFRKFDSLATSWVELPKFDRLLLYRFLCGVVLTAHAKRIKDHSQRNSLYALKNKLYLSIANDFASRKVLNFRLLVSPRFKVVEYCADCTSQNKEQKLPKLSWKFCDKCTVDRDYFNVLSMFHKFKLGGASLFLGNELIGQVKGLRVLKRAKFAQLDEEITFQKYVFNSRNCVSIDVSSAMDAALKILDVVEKSKKFDPVTSFGTNGKLSEGRV
jgi:hypothetical protein